MTKKPTKTETIDEVGEPWPTEEAQPVLCDPKPRMPLSDETHALSARIKVLTDNARDRVTAQINLGYERINDQELVEKLVNNIQTGQWADAVAYVAMLAENDAKLPAFHLIEQDDLTKFKNDMAQRAEDLKARDAIIDELLLGLTRVTNHVPPPLPDVMDAQGILKNWRARGDFLIEHVQDLVRRAAFNQGRVDLLAALEKENADLKAAHDDTVDQLAELQHRACYMDQDRQDWKDHAILLGKIIMQVTKPE